ncbi:LptF/LptG family permease [Acetobacter sp. TBRC 12305]|uniref:LptF/LptG family permease n=1 Tax=Acetobacter garciniae TaxID=2817435 RepID=A0A939KRQ3_9PROT|nr:LptF/LptG family permease [Acetobacter garciniae]MBX0345726.1 LptF/LptG family permease [Acetobacter garciniae]
MSRHVLLRYLSGTLFMRVMFCCVVLVGLLEILALLEQTTPILQRHLGVRGILSYAGMRLPFLLTGSLPLSVLIGALVMLTQLTLSSEIAILRACGLSTIGLYVRLIPATLVIGLAGVVMDDQFTPRSEQALAAWWNRTDPQPDQGRAFWFRDNGRVLRVGYVSDGGNMLTRIDIYTRGPDGLLTQALHAQRATYTGAQGWTLHDVTSVNVHDSKVERPAPLADSPWPTGLRPADFIRLAADTPPLSTTTVLGMLRGRLPSDSTPAYLQAGLLERFLRPLSLLVLLLLALPVIYIPPRTGTRSWLPVWCLGAGLLFIIVQGLLRAMGNAELLPPALATVPGLVIFTLGALSILIRSETR